MSGRSKIQKFQGLEEFDSNSDNGSESSGGEDLFKGKKQGPQGHQRLLQKQERKSNSMLIQNIRKSIKEKRQRKLTMSEEVSLRNYISQISFSKLAHFNDDEVEKSIVNSWLKGQTTLNNEDVNIDTHELLKKNIGLNNENDSVANTILGQKLSSNSNAVRITSILDNKDSYSVQRLLNTKALICKEIILLDSRWRSLDTNDGINFNWARSNVQNMIAGSFYLSPLVSDIIEMKVLPFSIPSVSTATTNNLTKNISMFIHEFSNQSVVGHEKRKFHYWFKYTVESNYLILNAIDYNRGKFKFSTPLSTINNLTINFGAPMNLINFGTDRAVISSITPASPTAITFSTAHGLATNDIVIFTDLAAVVNVSNPSKVTIESSLNTALNNVAGVTATVINDYSITLAIDTSAADSITIKSPGYFLGKRFYIPIEISYIKRQNNKLLD